MSKNEDYLDQLLNQFTKSGQGKDENQLSLDMDLDLDTDIDTDINTNMDSKKEKPSIRNTEDDFIRQFENEMDEFNSERLISEFEMELDESLIEPDIEEAPIDTDFFSGLNEAMGRKEQASKKAIQDETSQNKKDDEEPISNWSTIEGTSKEEIIKKEVLTEKMADAEANEKDIIEIEADNIEFVTEEAYTPQEEPKIARKQVNLDSDEDILELLSGLAGENEELSDIANMLKADENHELILDDGILDMDQELKDIAEKDSNEEAEEDGTKKKKTKKKKIKKEKIKNEKIKNENALMAKLSKTLFGEDEVELIEAINSPIPELDGTETPEELEILENLKNADIVIKTKEEQEKEDKLKLAQDKKAEKQKLAQEKKKEKQAKKAENKTKKADKPVKVKPVDKTPPLPKVSVIMIYLMGISFLVFVLLATKVSGYQLAKNQAKELYEEENYVEAYSVIAGIDLKQADSPLREKIVLLAGLQEEYSAYTTFFKVKKYEQALDALVRGIGRYQDGLKAATNLDVIGEYGIEYAKLQEALSLNYKITDEEAIRLYQIKKRNLYSVELLQIVNGLTFQ